MKVAHYYPGLRYKSLPVKRDIFSDRKIQERLAQASAALKKDVAALCRATRPFQSTEECFVVTFTVCAVLGEYYTQRAGDPDMIFASSFGHYAALVLAESLTFQTALSLAQNNGRTIDQHFSDHLTYLVNGIPFIQLKRLASGMGPAVAFIPYSDGLALTFPEILRSRLSADVERLGGKFQRIPLRLEYHSPFMQEAEKATWHNLDNLALNPPRLPFLSAYCADFVHHPSALMYVLKNRISSPNLVEESLAVMKKERVTQIIHMGPAGIRFTPIKPG